jgi:hypothetical protein
MFGHDNSQHDSVNNSLGGAAIDPVPAADDTLAAPTPAVSTSLPANPSLSDTSLSDDLVSGPALASTPSNDDLLGIKQGALQQLTPLVSHLNQTPEEKFHTTMMMIQSSDNQSMIKDAYEAAQQIPDDKARAQALLDVVNEINYFTQHSANPS